MKTASSRSPDRLWRLYAILAALFGVTALIWLLRIPGEGQGLSKTRLALAVTLVLWSGVWGALATWTARWTVWAERALQPSLLYGILLIGGLLMLFLSTQLLYLERVVVDPYVHGYLSRLAPFLFLGATFALQTVLLLPMLRRYSPVRPRGQGWHFLVGIYVILLALWGLMAFTGLGLKPDVIGWDPPGTPVLPLQVVVAVFAGALMLLLGAVGRQPRDTVFSLLIWIAAVWLWGVQPMRPDYFSPAPRPPNFEFYPYSDAATHDVLAQRLLIGAGFPGVARKPLYAVFLAGLHLLGGQDYGRIAVLQVMALALLPVVVYVLGKRLHSRAAGVIAAVLIILRERNAIALSGEIGVSHAKLLMSDLPATLGVAALTLLLVSWLGAPQRRPRAPIFVGGMLGLLLLLRPQTSVLAVAVILLSVLWFWRQPRQAMLHAALLILGLGVTLAPWLLRSHRLIGKFALNDPNQNVFLTELYTLTPGEPAVTRLPGESEGEFSRRVDAYLSGFIRQHPDVVARFVVAHFAHSLAEMVVTLPMSPWVVSDGSSDLFPHWRQQGEKLWRACCSAAAYVHAMPFWDDWRGALPPGGAWMLAFNLFLVAAGIVAAWGRRGALGLIPLGVGLVYVGSTALGRYSGWRLILPADWVLFFYYALGWGQALRWGWRYAVGPIGAQRRGERGEPSGDTEKKLCSLCPCVSISGGARWAVSALILLLLGALPVLAERIAPYRYADDPPVAALKALAPPEDALILWGRAFYPRFYPRGQGEPGGTWTAFAPRDFPRLGFVLLNERQFNVILPLDAPPTRFPHAADALVVGCARDDVFIAQGVVLLEEDGYTAVRSDADPACGDR